jgi:hypothetical protein
VLLEILLHFACDTQKTVVMNEFGVIGEFVVLANFWENDKNGKNERTIWNEGKLEQEKI